MNTDPIADAFTIIRNAQLAQKPKVSLPFSKEKLAIAELLSRFDFVGPVKKKGRGEKKDLEIVLKYRENGKAKIREIKRGSKPGCRIYLSAKEIYPFKAGRGMRMISTSQGLMAGHEAKKKGIGGELIGQIW